ncbi:hypothetical protein [Microlunatus ginsengisoli]|uniref:NfeD-like C-terminal domain-containing protein n=1 Tax=Microlunatus ginsengisoli TaxID=363863 RepID=A0ABP6ZC45_9ACTN
MLAFLIIGGIGIVLLLIAVIVGDALGGALDSIGIGADWVTGAVAGFLGAFGFAGALALGLTDSTLVAVLVGLVAGIGFGALAAWGTRELQRGDDSTVRSAALVGLTGTVISAIPEQGYGEISVVVAGHLTKLNARCAEPVPSGHAVIVDAVLSPTSVSVTPRML